MSQQMPYSSVSQERNVYIKVSRANNKVRSGIIERYTYKSDNGKVLNNSTSPSKSNSSCSSFSGSQSVILRKYSPKETGPTIIKTSKTAERLPTKQHFIHPNVTLNIDNTSRNSNEKVRTEHCDSTTDIIENMEQATKLQPHDVKLFSDVDHSYVRYKKLSPSNSDISKLNSSKMSHEDSDSDCQIIDIVDNCNISVKSERYPVSQDDILTQNSDKNIEINDININNTEESPNSKVKKWFENAINESMTSEVHIISDSEEEIDNKIFETKNFDLSSSTSNTPVTEMLNVSSSTPVKQEDTVSLINAKYHVVKNLLSAEKKTHVISNVKELSQQCLFLKSKPPDLSTKLMLSPTKSVLGARLDVTPPKVQKLNLHFNSQMSPESMKSEFYSYLKINTNPSAQKTETVAQNRRSTRVKNLILQIEKNKEIKNEKEAREKDKNNDVRKKFMKYSKFKFVFPKLPVQYNTKSDFGKCIEPYFLQEKIKYPKNNSDNDKKNSVDIKERKYRTNKKKFIKKSSKLKQSSNAQQFGDKKIRRLRYGRHRGNTSVRITRNSLNGFKNWNIQMLKTKKKLRTRIKKSTNPSKEKDLDKPKSINKSSENDKEEKSLSIFAKLREPKERCILKTISNHIQDKSEDVTQPKPKEMKNCTILLQMSNTRLKNSLNSPRKDCETSKYTHLTPNSTETTLHSFCRSTPVSESGKELEIFTSSSQNTKIQNNDKSKKINLRSTSPPFLGFESEEKIVSTLSTQVSQFEITLSSESDVDYSDNQLLDNKTQDQVQDVISLTSSGKNTPVDEDSNSGSSSLQGENQVTTIQEVVDTNLIEFGNRNYIPLNQNIKPKSFHKSLMQSYVKRKSLVESNRSSLFELSDSDSSMSTPKASKSPIKKLTHEIDICKGNGAVFNTYYVNGILIIVQEQLITFWKQTALGNILGVQNMWLPHGSIQRIILDPGCVNRRSSEMILCCDNAVAYIELWTKEHKCMFRECPIADVFATIYFHKGHGIPDKKVLQLENIKGYGDDVRFVVVRHSREIIVSWCDTFSKPIKTLVRSYQFSADFQTISSIKEMENVPHYISSLHNIHDCDDLVMGAGNEQISVWNLRHGYLVTTLDLSEMPVQVPSENKTICLYAQCDTGFLFLIQQTEVGVLRLVAVNGMTQEWKQLHSYQVPENYKKLLGVVVESGVLMTCYTNGFLCWNMHSGEVLAEIDTPNELIVLPSNKYMVAIDNYQVTVQHIMSYILTHDW